jgi:hypothetical protein
MLLIAEGAGRGRPRLWSLSAVPHLLRDTSQVKNLQLYGALERQISEATDATVVPAKKAAYADLAEKFRYADRRYKKESSCSGSSVTPVRMPHR